MRYWTLIRRLLPQGSVLAGLCLFAVFFGITACFQWASGAWMAEFGQHPDEAAHYVTGLMVKNFILHGQINSPLTFAEQYYLHYPKVALGHWGPIFYILQAAWGVLFGSSRISLMLFMAVPAALLGLLIYRIARPECSRLLSVLAALLFLSLPLTQRLSAAVMTELWSSLFLVLAAGCFARFLERQGYRDIIGFALLSSVAILIKGNGLLLALVPLLAMGFARRMRLLLHPRLWIAPLIVLLLCGPWYACTFHLQMNGVSHDSFRLNLILLALPYYSKQLIEAIGVVGFTAALLGFFHRVGMPLARCGAEPKWAVVAALLLSAWSFHWLFPIGLESRHIMVAIPSALILSAAGVAWVSDCVGGVAKIGKAIATPLAVFCFVLAFAFSFRLHDASCSAFHRVLDDHGGGGGSPVVMLVSSDETGDGMLVADAAMRSERPHNVVLRASKLLSTSLWDGSAYQPFFNSPVDIQKRLESIPVDLVIVDTTLAPSRYPDNEQLRTAIKLFQTQWKLVGKYPVRRRDQTCEEGIEVYRRNGDVVKQHRKIVLDMRYGLGRSIEMEQ